MDIQKEIQVTEDIISLQINKLNNQINILERLSKKTERISETEWHDICSTPLKNSEVLCDIVKNYIFPEAKNVSLRSRHVRFMLNGFTCYLPTADTEKIEIDTGWYRSYESCKDIYHEKISPAEIQMRKYFKAKADHANWRTLARILLPERKEWELPILWFCWYRWRSDGEICWKVQFAVTDAKRRLREDKAKQAIKEMQEKAKLFEETVKYLKTFSENIKNEEKIKDIFCSASLSSVHLEEES